MKIDTDNNTFEMRVNWHGSGEAEEHLIEIGPSKKPVCWMLVGYASGYASFCLDRDIYFIEKKCRAKGDRICSAVGKDRPSWGRDITRDLPFFEADEVQGKIERLTDSVMFAA